MGELMSRHVIITGASRGIGSDIAAAFVAAGDTVTALSRSGTAPAGVARSIAVDLTDREATDAALNDAIDQSGPPAVLVANAGITRDNLALRMNDDDWDEVIETNLTSVFRATRRVLKPMIRERSGRIIFISSVSPFMGIPGQANYAASKAGLVGLARSLAREVATRSITVNVVAPGLISTDMTQDLSGDLTSQIPLGRPGHGSDVAAAVTFLASDSASYITGAVIPVDGGLGMGW
jgi:3-oxoacyl-[acyl-carrier protein] reductase